MEEYQCLRFLLLHLLQYKDKGISKTCMFYIFSLKQERATQSNTDISFLQEKVRVFLRILSHFSLIIAHLFSRIKMESIVFFPTYTQNKKKVTVKIRGKNGIYSFFTGRLACLKKKKFTTFHIVCKQLPFSPPICSS